MVGPWQGVLVGIGLLVVLLLVGEGVLAFFLGRFLSTPIPNGDLRPDTLGLAYETKRLTLTRGTVEGWYIHAEHPKALVILVHGFGTPTGGKTNILPHARYLHAHGYAVFAYDQAGFGGSYQRKKTLGNLEANDLAEVYDHFKREYPFQSLKVGFLGFSMGGTTVVQCAGKTGKGDFVISGVGYSSKLSFLGFQTGNPVLQAVVSPLIDIALTLQLGWDYDRYSPIHVVKNLKVPVLYFSATQDKQVPPSGSLEMYQGSPEGLRELQRTETGHSVYQEDPALVELKVLSFLERRL